MAENTAIIGFGATIAYADTSGGSYTPIAELLDLPLPEVTTEKVEATHNASPNTTKEYIPGLNESGDYVFQCNFNKTQYAALFALQGVEKFFKITVPDTSLFGPFKGFISGRSGDMPIGDRIVAEITIAPCGHIPFDDTP